MYVFNIKFKMWHDRIATNRCLYQIAILDSPNCIYCDEIENMTHALLFCSYIIRSLDEVETFAKDLQYDFFTYRKSNSFLTTR